MSRLAELQRQFAAHLRDPAGCPPPADVEPRRMAVYRELFFNNLSGLISATFPVCRDVLGDASWTRLVRSFYSGHHARTPYFPDLPREFLEWLQERSHVDPGEPPFLPELAHYEWVELALAISEGRNDVAEVDPAGDLMTGHPVVSPLAWPLAYRWPVTRIAADYRPAEPPPQPTFVVLLRDAVDDVHIIEVSAVAARLLDLAEREPACSGTELLRLVAAEMGVAGAADLLDSGRRVLEELRGRGIVLGTRRMDTPTTGMEAP